MWPETAYKITTFLTLQLFYEDRFQNFTFSLTLLHSGYGDHPTHVLQNMAKYYALFEQLSDFP
jgi:hypothetical protein